MKKTFYFILFIAVVNLDVIASTIDSLIFGHNTVGFKVQEYTDLARNSRTVKIFTWYPAVERQSNIQTKVSDYLKYDIKISGSRKKWEPILKKSTKSFIEPAKINGEFPLIIIGQGYHFESPISLAILAEYLASYGYVVSTCALKGTEQQAVMLNLTDLETQVMDMEFVMTKTLENNQTISRIGVIGFDLGGLSAALLSMHNTCINCIISLDGGLIFKHNLDYIEKSPCYIPLQFTAPLLQITRSTKDNIAMGLKEDFSFFDSTSYSKKYLLRFENIKHKEFTSYNLMGIDNEGSGNLYLNKSKTHKAVYIYHEFILNFVNAYLKGDTSAMTFINDPITRHNFEIPVTLEFFKIID